jgi:1-acyl-sn-glycerol-3-phosphate acyltransferase
MGRLYRAVLVGGTLLTFFSVSILFWPLLKMKPYFTKKIILIPLSRFCCRCVLKILNFKVITTQPIPKFPETVTVVSNHLGYMDMPVLYSIFPGSFITAYDVKKIPIFGMITELSGTLFVNRESREQQGNEKEVVGGHLDHGLNVAFFPEAKATHGFEVVRFRRPFFRPGFDRKKDFLACTINYLTVNGEKLNRENCHKVLWYRQKGILEHLWELLLITEASARVEFEIVKAEEYLNQPDDVADFIHKKVSSRYISIPEKQV